MPSATISSLIDNLQDPLSLEIRAQIARIADLDTPVLICGETGSGKDVWVDYLQAISRYPRLLNLHCGDVPETLLESEWFGYTKGAFTGADRDYEGKWQSADNGIIFLNQVDLLSLNLQAKLLRIIERKKYYPLGSNREVTIQARFVFSADSGIEERVARGEFRSDLYYRIAVYKIFIPPLRERPKDLRALLAFFAGREGVRLEMNPKPRRCCTAIPGRATSANWKISSTAPPSGAAPSARTKSRASTPIPASFSSMSKPRNCRWRKWSKNTWSTS